MIIRARNGRVTVFRDGGNVFQQVKNLSAVISKMQVYATILQTTAAEALSVDPALVSLNRALEHQVKTLQNTLSLTEKQIKRNREEKKDAK